MIAFRHLCLLLLVIAPEYLLAQTSQQEFHSAVASVYNFYPHDLNDKQLQEKSNELDIFWDKVKASKSTLLPFFRAELCDFTNNSFFLYDGSQLLLSLSSDPDDKKIALNAIPRADLRDVQNTAKGDSAIAMYATDPQKPESAKEVAKELQSRKKLFSPSLFAMFASSDLSALKKERSKIMHRISDEALYELKDVTEKIRIAYHEKK